MATSTAWRGQVPRSGRAAIAAFALLALGLVGGAILLHRSMQETARRDAGARLEAIAALKVAAIDTWRAEHLRDTGFAASYPTVALVAREASRGPVTPHDAAHALEVLVHLAERLGHLRIALLAADGHPVLAWARPGAPEEPFAEGLLRTALESPAGAASALVADPGRGRPRLHAAVSLRAQGAPGFALALQVDMGQVFDDVIWSWPVPSATGGTALVRREGGEVLLFVGGGAGPGREVTATRLPAEARGIVAAKAAAGETGIVEGMATRGQPILAAIRPVPGTSWKLVAKMDLSEVYEPIERPFSVMGGLLTSLLAAGALLLVVWWRHEAAQARMAAELRESHDLFQLALAGTHRVWDWDLEAKRIAIERTGAEGQAPDRDVYRGEVPEILAQLVHPDHVEEVRGRFEAHVRGETPGFEVETRSLVRPEGDRWVLVRGRGTRRDASGRARRVTGVVTDVTAHREMQAKLERSERLATIGELAAGVAHEINNPLAYVLSNLHFVVARLRAEGSREEELEALTDARDGAERVRDVVRRLRSYSRPGEGPRVLTDVQTEIQVAARLAAGEIHGRARLELRLGRMPLVEAGQHELGQLFVNLLVNAAHAIPPGRPTENSVVVEGGTDERGWARVEVRDSGEGIPPHVLRRVFEPFFTTKTGGKGTGLGMAIAQKIVTGAGGRIEIESRVGEGTAVRVTLPPAAGERRGEPPAAGRRMLVVDGDPLLARSLVRTIGGEHDVVSAASAAEALTRLRAGERFEAILCEVAMPRMTGAELHARIAEIAPDQARRMIFVSGGAYDEEASAFLRRVGNPCLEKPFDAQELRQALAWAAGGRGGAGAAPGLEAAPASGGEAGPAADAGAGEGANGGPGAAAGAAGAAPGAAPGANGTGPGGGVSGSQPDGP
jgi:signal transduction histidine kinase/ActR/RegA family two-component response regulator